MTTATWIRAVNFTPGVRAWAHVPQRNAPWGGSQARRLLRVILCPSIVLHFIALILTAIREAAEGTLHLSQDRTIVATIAPIGKHLTAPAFAAKLQRALVLIALPVVCLPLMLAILLTPVPHVILAALVVLLVVASLPLLWRVYCLSYDKRKATLRPEASVEVSGFARSITRSDAFAYSGSAQLIRWLPDEIPAYGIALSGVVPTYKAIAEARRVRFITNMLRPERRMGSHVVVPALYEVVF